MENVRTEPTWPRNEVVDRSLAGPAPTPPSLYSRTSSSGKRVFDIGTIESTPTWKVGIRTCIPHSLRVLPCSLVPRRRVSARLTSAPALGYSRLAWPDPWARRVPVRCQLHRRDMRLPLRLPQHRGARALCWARSVRVYVAGWGVAM